MTKTKKKFNGKAGLGGVKVAAAPEKRRPGGKARDGNPQVNCAHAKLVATAKLRPNPDNPNKHSPEQLKLYAKIILHQGWRKAVVVSNQTGLIVTGHGAWLTAQAEGWPTVPVDYQDFKTRADEFAHLIADNKLPQLAELDDAALAKCLEVEIGDKLDLDLTGFEFSEDRTGDAVGDVGLPDEPASVEKNLEHMRDIKSQRATGNANIMAKTDTEFYLVLAFANRRGKEGLLRRLGLPADERYIPAESVLILPGDNKRKLKLPKASPPNKSGACG